MAGGGGNSTTTQKADPWVGMQPALSSLYNNANSLYNQGALAPPQILGNYQPMNDQQWGAISQMLNGNGSTNSALDLTNKLAYGDFTNSYGAQVLKDIAGGTDTSSQALIGILSGQNAGAAALTKTANGDYTDPNNPYAQMLYQAQAAPVTKSFQNATLPGLLSAYSSAGRYGSGSNDTAINAASDSLAQNLNSLSQQTIGQNYYNERQNQLTAAQQLAALQGNAASSLSGARLNAGNQLSNLQGSAISALDQMGWNRTQQALNAGTLIQQNTQAQSDAQVAQYNYDSSRALMGTQNLSQILQGGFSLNGQTQTQSGGTSRAVGALGGAASGALAGSAFGPWGTAIGAGAGLLLGGLS